MGSTKLSSLSSEAIASSPIPIVDFSKWHHSSPSSRLELAHELISALREVGFVYLLNHGLPQSLLDQAFATSKSLFDLTHEEKMLAPHPPTPDHHRGYSPPGMEKVSQPKLPTSSTTTNEEEGKEEQQQHEALRAVPDVKESYEIGSEANASQPNIWLPEPVLPGFRTQMSHFYWQCHALALELLRAIALGLGLRRRDHDGGDAADALDLEFFARCHSGINNQLRLLHYPRVRATDIEHGRAERIAAHSDWGSITLLFQDDCGGLEVEDPRRAGHFVPATPVAGACVVNVGDLLMRWSNDFLKSTLHRVTLPPLSDRYEGPERWTRARYSIPYFVAADSDTLVECVPACTDAERPAKYDAVTQDEYARLRAKGQYRREKGAGEENAAAC